MSYGGIYKGVISTIESGGTGRVKLVIPQLSQSAVTNWAYPSSPSTITVDVPPEGTVVWVLFEGGDIDYPVWISN